MLQNFAKTHNVKLVAVSIGGNNFNFASIVQTCVEDFLESTWFYDFYCSKESSVTNNFTSSNLSKVKGEIETGLRNVTQAMTNAGYSSSQYTLLVQDYPAPIPLGSGFRYTQSGYSRQTTGGCGFWNTDANYADEKMLPAIDSTVLGAANALGLSNVRTMELASAFNGRRLCEKGVGLLEEEGLKSWTQAGRGRQNRVGQRGPDGLDDLRPLRNPGRHPPELLGPAGASQLPHAGLQRRYAEGWHVHDRLDRSELSGRAEHVAALSGRLTALGSGEPPPPAPSPHRQSRRLRS